MSYTQLFEQELIKLKKNNLYRKPKNNKTLQPLVNFCCNDYLGLAKNLAVKNAAIKAVRKYGFGGMASRYVFDENSLALKLEKKLAQLKNCPQAIVLGSGYLSSCGIIPALIKAGDIIIADKLIHSSLLDGAKLSGAKLFRFKHNNIAHCEQIMQRELGKNQSGFDQKRKCLIISETVFSMDGDLGKIADLLNLAQKYQCLLLTDDAHGLGIIKPNYQPYNQHLQAGTLSKAAGGYGGYVCGSNLLIEYLRNFTKTAIYSTNLPPAVLAANLKAIQIISKDQKLGKKTLANAQYFWQMLGEIPNQNPTNPESAIAVIIIGNAAKTLKIAQNLKKQGFLISAIRPPTVANNSSRLRITFNAKHTQKSIAKLANLLKKQLVE